MHEDVAARLLQLNLEFYQTFGQAFAETRSRVQPGVLLALEDLPSEASVLDLGCGSGQLARELARRGHRGTYLGLDWSLPLLEEARAGPFPPGSRFEMADLTSLDWARQLQGTFAQVFALAVLHHLPGDLRRLRFLAQARSLLTDQGEMVVSTWNFLASMRLRERIVGWETIDLHQDEVDPGDYLLDWRHRGHGLRYVHHFTQQDLSRLAESADLRVLRTYYSDGEGGRLGLYQVWACP